MTHNITIKPVSGHELYCRYYGQINPQPVSITLDPAKRELSAGYDANIGRSVTFDVFHRRHIEFGLFPAEGDKVNELMEEIAPYCSQIADEYEEEWDGNNWTGKHSADAEVCIEEVQSICDNASAWIGTLFEWEACEWLAEVDLVQDHGLHAAMTEKEIEKLAEELNEIAISEVEDLVGLCGVEEYITELVEELRDEES